MPLKKAPRKQPTLIYLSPQGQKFDQDAAAELVENRFHFSSLGVMKALMSALLSRKSMKNGLLAIIF